MCYEKIEKLFDRFLEEGFSYFDTAYTYHGYQAEKAVKKALVDRYPRERFQLATKMPLRDFKDEEDLERIFAEQLDNCGVDYFDFYLLHNMGRNVYNKCCRYHAFDFVKKKKEEGKIKAVGMSFHDMPELLEEILEKYGDRLDFLQLQINYIDWEQPNVQAKKCLEIANKYEKPMIVMEPCKGGTLVNVPKEAEDLMKEYHPELSVTSWAMRFAASQQVYYNNIVLNDHGKASDCIRCGKCEQACPQHLPIREYLEKVEEKFEGGSILPVRK